MELAVIINSFSVEQTERRRSFRVIHAGDCYYFSILEKLDIRSFDCGLHGNLTFEVDGFTLFDAEWAEEIDRDILSWNRNNSIVNNKDVLLNILKLLSGSFV